MATGSKTPLSEFTICDFMVIIPSQILNVGEFSRTVSSSRLTDSLEQAFCLLWSSIVWTFFYFLFFLGGGGGGGGGVEDVNDRDNPDEACVDNPDKFAQKRLPCRVIPPILWTLSLIYVLAAVTVVTSQVPCYLFEWCNLLFCHFCCIVIELLTCDSHCSFEDIHATDPLLVSKRLALKVRDLV